MNTWTNCGPNRLFGPLRSEPSPAESWARLCGIWISPMIWMTINAADKSLTELYQRLEFNSLLKICSKAWLLALAFSLSIPRWM